MFKSKLMLAAALAFAGFAAGSAQAQTIVYAYTWYSDASHSTVVGHSVAHCYDDGSVSYTIVGTQTQYEDQEAAFICDVGGPRPLD